MMKITKDNQYLIVIVGAILVLLVGGLVFGFSKNLFKKPESGSSISGKESQALKEEAALGYTATFSFQGPERVEVNQPLSINLKFKAEETPENKGIIGIRLVMKFTPSTALSLSPNDIQPLLSQPWQYLRREVNEEGEIIIEAIYLQSGEKGYSATQEQTLAVLTLDTLEEEKVRFLLDDQKSYLVAKEGNQKIYFPNNFFWEGQIAK